MLPFNRALLCTAALIFTGQALSAPVPLKQTEGQTCYTFKEKDWRFSHNRKKRSLPVIGDHREMLLIPDDTFQTGVAASIPNPYQPPFEVTFDYSTWDNDGSDWAVWNSGDGLTFFFLKDAANYGTPPDGGTLGLSSEGGGYAVGFHLYGSRFAQLTGPHGMVLDRNFFARAYSQRQWVPVKISVLADRISVQADNQLILEQALELQEEFRDMGFTAATGAADAEHVVRNLCLKKIVVQEAVKSTTASTQPKDKNPEKSPEAKSADNDPEPATSSTDEYFVPAPGLEGLDTFPAQNTYSR